jgi:hypothetical protein
MPSLLYSAAIQLTPTLLYSFDLSTNYSQSHFLHSQCNICSSIPASQLWAIQDILYIKVLLSQWTAMVYRDGESNSLVRGRQMLLTFTLTRDVGQMNPGRCSISTWNSSLLSHAANDVGIATDVFTLHPYPSILFTNFSLGIIGTALTRLVSPRSFHAIATVDIPFTDFVPFT